MPSRDFDERYRSIVGPRLRQSCRYRGFRVACDDETFTEAHAAVIRDAWRLGGSHVTQRLWDALVDQIQDWLIEAIESSLPIMVEAEERADRVAADLGRYFSAWEAAQQ